MARRIYFVAGEASGDSHGAALMEALRAEDPELVFLGRGGPKMRALAGGNFLDWTAEAAVLGLWEVLKKYGYFRREFAAALREIRAQLPDAVVLVDYPGFNLRLARALRAELPHLKIIYYISPQVWAWNRRRIPQMARTLDLMLCIFPFEAPLYNESGLRTKFVGHPLMETLGAEARRTRETNLVGLFPGSRLREVRKIFPVMLRAAELLRAEMPELKFEVAAASEALAQEMRKTLPPSMQLTVSAARDLMQRAAVGMVASGTATLEAAFFGLPFVLIYKVSALTYAAGKMVIRVPHLGMPNVLAGREIVPEFIQEKARPEAIASAVAAILRNPDRREKMVANFAEVIAQLGRGGASKTAAHEILQALTQGARA